jgi:hypothetical protein
MVFGLMPLAKFRTGWIVSRGRMVQGGRCLDLGGSPLGLRGGRARGSNRQDRPYSRGPSARSTVSIETVGDGADAVIIRILTKQLSINAEEAPDGP